MVMVGNVGVNRVKACCLDFEDIRQIKEMIFQSPGGFEAVQQSFFYRQARQKERRLARRVIRGERRDPAPHTLWFYRLEEDCPLTWFDQSLSGRYKSHCFYAPEALQCPAIC